MLQAERGRRSRRRRWRRRPTRGLMQLGDYGALAPAIVPEPQASASAAAFPADVLYFLMGLLAHSAEDASTLRFRVSGVSKAWHRAASEAGKQARRALLPARTRGSQAEAATPPCSPVDGAAMALLSGSQDDGSHSDVAAWSLGILKNIEVRCPCHTPLLRAAPACACERIARLRMHTHKRARTQTHTHARAESHTHTYARACTSCACVHAHTRTRARARFFWKAYLPIESTLNGKRPRIGP